LYKLAVIVPFYKGVESSIEQSLVDEFSSISDDVLRNIQLIFVDDCSLVPLNIVIKNERLNFSLYRIDTDINWNVGGAKNLGAHLSEAEILLFFDADRCIKEDAIKYLLKLDINENQHVVFVNEKKGSPGTLCTTRKRFLELKGFDEKFSGNYGFEDINYRIRHENSGGSFIEVDGFISIRQRYQHHTLKRDRIVNRKIMSDIEP